MAQFYDFLLDSDGDLLIANGDFVIGPADEDLIEDIIDSFVGHWKEFPSVGVGIKKYQGSSGQEQEIERSIKMQLQADGYNISVIRVVSEPDSTFKVYTDATRG